VRQRSSEQFGIRRRQRDSVFLALNQEQGHGKPRGAVYRFRQPPCIPTAADKWPGTPNISVMPSLAIAAASAAGSKRGINCSVAPAISKERLRRRYQVSDYFHDRHAALRLAVTALPSGG